MACYTLQVTDPEALFWATREVPLSDLVSTYLRAIAPSAYCDPCLAPAVQEPLEPVHQTTEGLTKPGQFARKLGHSKLCRSTKRIVTRVDRGRS